jgi:antirestriction protein ArdC
VLVLGFDLRAFRTGDPRWCSYRQAQEQGWHVRAGEKGTTIFYTNTVDINDEQNSEDKKTVRFFKYSSVFHLSQMDGAPPFKAPTIEEAPWRSHEATEIILQRSGATIRIGGDRAFYSSGAWSRSLAITCSRSIVFTLLKQLFF